MKVIAKQKIKHNGTYYKTGEVFEITDTNELERLALMGAIGEHKEKDSAVASEAKKPAKKAEAKANANNVKAEEEKKNEPQG